MERRSFLKVLFGGAAALTAGTMLDPDKLLWVPGAKTIFIPSGDIAVRNIRTATAEETAAITGEHFLRIKYHAPKLLNTRVWLGAPDRERLGHRTTVEEATVIPEKDFAIKGLRLLEGATDVEVHFDDGSIAYGVKPAMTLAEIRAKAQANTKAQAQRRAERRRFLHVDSEEYERAIRSPFRERLNDITRARPQFVEHDTEED